MWPRAVIRRLAEKATAGIKLFVGHNSDSSHSDRSSVGEVVGSFTRTVNGKLQALALTVLDKVDSALDVCSIEADVEFPSPDMAGDVTNVTGIALGSSKRDSPAFPGAVRLASLQCFGEQLEDDKPKPLEKGDKKVTFDEVQKAVQEMNIFPRQLFNLDQIKDDKEFGKIYTENETLTKTMETTNNKLTELEKSGKETERKAGLSDANARFDKLIPEGTTDKAKAFMKKQFKPDSIEDLTDDSLKKTVDQFQKDYSEYAKIFGVEEDKNTSGGPSGGESEKGEKDDPIDSAVDELMEA